MRVNINAQGRQVEIECSDTNTTPKDIAAEALAVWRATEPNSQTIGFASSPHHPKRASRGQDRAVIVYPDGRGLP